MKKKIPVERLKYVRGNYVYVNPEATKVAFMEHPEGKFRVADGSQFIAGTDPHDHEKPKTNGHTHAE